MKLGISYDDALKNVFNNEIFDVDFLDKFNIANVALDVSVVFVTYNRCPYDPKSEKGSLNPLVLSIRSVLKQKIKVKEIVIVNDCSNDYTEEVVKWFKHKTSEHEIIYIKNKRRLGSSKSRNVGVKKASSNYIMFSDDDCILTPYACFGAVYSFEKMKKRGYDVGGVVMPVYDRTTLPNKIIGKNFISTMDFGLAEYHTNWGAFPVNYISLDKKYFIDKEMMILKPIRVNSSCGCALFDKYAFQEVGGFPDHFSWPDHAGEDLELAARLIENGYSLFFCPDPKFHFFHTKFGDETHIDFTGNDWLDKKTDLSFKDIVKDAEIKRRNTGNRVDLDDRYIGRITSFFVICFRRNKFGAKRWIRNTYKIFVEKSKEDSGFFNDLEPIKDKEKRMQIWNVALEEGIKVIKKQDIKYRKEMINYIIRIK